MEVNIKAFGSQVIYFVEITANIFLFFFPKHGTLGSSLFQLNGLLHLAKSICFQNMAHSVKITENLILKNR